MAIKKKAPELISMLVDPTTPWEHKRHMMMMMMADEAGQEALQGILTAAATSKADEVLERKLREVQELMTAMEEGPKRIAVYVSDGPTHGTVHEIQVRLEDGSTAYAMAPTPQSVEGLRCGDQLLLDARARVVLARNPAALATGEVAAFVRRVGKYTVEVRFHTEECLVVVAAQEVLDKADSGDLKEGADVLVCRRRGVCFEALPPRKDAGSYRYLSKAPVPDVVAERDLGSPPQFIFDLTRHVEKVMCNPEVMQRYRLRKSVTRLLTGRSGTGKTYSIQAFLNKAYTVMSRITGVPMGQLPSRVLRLRMAEVLSKWLGDSDKNIDRFLDECERLAGEPFIGPDGKTHHLPVYVVVEECDGLARTRGSDQDAVYDRIQTTLLQRLDHSSGPLRELPIIFLFTTNIPHLVDAAFLRRAGGKVEHFGQLDRRSFRQVLSRQLRGLPIRSDNGTSPADLEKQIVDRITSWLFSANGEDGAVLELTFTGSPNPVPHRRRHFLTPALVDRAVQQASERASDAEYAGGTQGISVELLAAAIDEQVRSVANQVSRENAGDYIDIPDGARVATVRRLAGPAVLPQQIATGREEVPGAR